MKFNLLCSFLSIAVLIGCAQVQNSARIPAAIKDVGVIGPDGEVILYYREGDYIIVRACDNYTVLGITPEDARLKCQGKSNQVPVETFKEVIRNLVSMDHLNLLKPLTPEEVEAYLKDASSSDQIDAMVVELEKINNFIASYGSENANLVRRDELVNALASNEKFLKIKEKIKEEIEKALNLITNQTKLTLSKFSSDKDQFLYTVLKKFNPNQNFPCGLSGSIEERIKDCSYQLTSETEGFVLVTRSKNFKEVHKEVSTGLLWSDRLPENRKFIHVKHYCVVNLDEHKGLNGVKWRLPTIYEYMGAEKSGIRKALPNMRYWYWSSTEKYKPHGKPEARIFDGLKGDSQFSYYQDNLKLSTRCVGSID